MPETTVYRLTVWLYRALGPWSWSVGFYQLDGTWASESTHDSAESAAFRVHYLNGGHGA